MAYVKTEWKDRLVEHPNRYEKTGETADEVTLVPKPGTVTAEGTPLSATNLNKIEQGIEDAHDAVAAHEGRTDNPHAVTKSQVGLGNVSNDAQLKIASNLSDLDDSAIARTNIGLGNVPNYGVASQAQAEAGTASNVLMTPQRTKQYVDKRLQNDLQFRVNAGSVEYWDGSGWKSMAAVKSVQRGNTSLSSGAVGPDEENVTISSVNLNKSVVILSSQFTRSGSTNSSINVYAELTSATNLWLYLSSGSLGHTATVYWQVVEYY